MSRHRQRRRPPRTAVVLAALALAAVGVVLVEAPPAEAATVTWIRGTDGACSSPSPIANGATLTVAEARSLCVNQSPRGVARVEFSIDGERAATKRWTPYSLRKGAASGLTVGYHSLTARVVSWNGTADVSKLDIKVTADRTQPVSSPTATSVPTSTRTSTPTVAPTSTPASSSTPKSSSTTSPVLTSTTRPSSTTPTATPTTPSGSGAQSCPAFPAFPTDACTGVPAGTQLTTVNGDLRTTSDGQVVDARLITGDLIVGHDDVTVTNSQIKGNIVYGNNRGLDLRDVDLGADSCSRSRDSAQLLSGADYTLTRVHMHNGGADLLRLAGGSSSTIQVIDSLIDNGCFFSGDHFDAVQLYDPGRVAKVVVRHSDIDARPANAPGEGNSAIFWADHPGAGSSLVVEQSRLAGGQITLALYDASASSKVVLDARQNRFVRGSFEYDACAMSNSVPFNGTSGVKWVDNAFEDGTPISSC